MMVDYLGGNEEFVGVDGVCDDALDGGPGPAVHHLEDLVSNNFNKMSSGLDKILCLQSSPGSVSM